MLPICYKCVSSLKLGQLANVCLLVMRHIVQHADKYKPLPILLLCNLQLSFHTIIRKLNRNAAQILAGRQCELYSAASLQNKSMMNESVLTWLVVIKGIIQEQCSRFSRLSLLERGSLSLLMGFGSQNDFTNLTWCIAKAHYQ